jgi:hypothetical protein
LHLAARLSLGGEPVGGVDQAELDRKALEALVVNNPDLERLEALLNRFNIFEAVGLVRQEIKHSAFLAFLLDPQQNHGLRDAFIKRLLQEAIMSAPEASVPVTPIELSFWDLEQIEVRREWKHIDVFLVDERNRLAVIIENKIDTVEHSDQLRRYYEVVKRHYPNCKVIGLYLTPSGDEPSHEAYLPLSYGLICEILDSLAQSQASVSNSDLQVLVAHYTQMLRRHIVGDSEIAKLCRQIYSRHKRALNLIHEHRPDPKVETRNLLVKLIDEVEGLVYKGNYKSDYILFRPQEWDDSPALNTRESSAGFLRFVFHNRPTGRSGDLVLYLETRPGDERIRRKLFDMVHKNGSPFDDPTDPDKSDHPKLYHRTFLASAFYEEATDENREDRIREHWVTFLEEDLPRIVAALKQERWIWESSDDETENVPSRSERFGWRDGDIEIRQPDEDSAQPGN